MAFITKESSIVYEENGAVLAEVCFPEGEDGTAVSYTHLTLPTIRLV